MGKLKCAVVFLLLAGPLARAEEPWRLLIEPKFMRYDAAWPIPGSDATVLVPARLENGEVQPLRRDEILKLGVTREKILASAPKAASEVLATLKPQYVRDEHKVIQYAVLESDSPLTASAVLAPDFADQFADTLGPDLLVAIPSRYRILVFSKLSPFFKSMSDVVFVDYTSSPYPVSREVFQIRRGRIAAVGAYR